MERRFADRITPILLLFAVFGIAWIDLFLPQAPVALFSLPWFAVSTAKSLLRVGFIAFVMRQWLGLKTYDLGLSSLIPRAKDFVNGIMIAAAAAFLALAMAALGYLADASNPLLYPFAGVGLSLPAMLAMAASSLGIGYSEELFFRFFAVTTLEKAEFSPNLAILLSATLFGASHGSQGAFGIIGTGLLAILFSFFRAKGKGLHALALGHALYDFLILLAVI